jgi:endoglucanase
MVRLFLSINFLFLIGFAQAQSLAHQRCQNFEKGINLSNWLEAYWQPQFPTPGQYTRNSIAQMKAAGFKSLRLPVGFHSASSELPPYNLDTTHALFAYIDSAINWANDFDMNLIIDNHHGWDIADSSWRNSFERFTRCWSQLAQRYKYLDPNRFTFEILNEPGVFIYIDSLNELMAVTIDSIRQHTTEHSIIVSPNFASLGFAYQEYLPFADTNLIYTWHSYEPYEFTHQGFAWANGSPPAGATFPNNNDFLLRTSWQTIIDWRNTYNKPVFLGEFGVGVNADLDSRCNWINYFGKRIDSLNMPYFYWDWQYDFSMFKSNIIAEDSIYPCFKNALALYGTTFNNVAENELLNNSLMVYPNPANNHNSITITIGNISNAKGSIVDACGKTVAEFTFSESYQLNLKDFEEGIYFVTVTTEKQRLNAKLLVLNK